jgi:predicted MFS family arabinose efflux permease
MTVKLPPMPFPLARTASGQRLVALVCTAQVLVQIGAYSWPALIPSMIGRWTLSNSDAGWITGIFYAAYMIAVPVLVTLTDRTDPKRIYLFGVGSTVASHLLFAVFAEGFWSALALRALAGIGWAGTYMTGLKLLADRVDARMMSRAVTGHAASIGIAGAISYALTGLISDAFGWHAAFAMAGAAALAAWLLVAFTVPRAMPAADSTVTAPLFDFRPVLRNRSAMAYSLAYCIHTLEMSALRGWGVAFLGFVALSAGAADSIPDPTLIMTAVGLIGTVASVAGNEVAMRLGRKNLIALAMLSSAAVGACLGFFGPASYGLAAGMLVLYGLLIWLDSSSLTAGAAGSAVPSRRGATLAVHSTLGYFGGFIGPLIIGFILDLGGGMSRANWGIAFLAISILILCMLVAFWAINPRGVEGDRAG